MAGRRAGTGCSGLSVYNGVLVESQVVPSSLKSGETRNAIFNVFTMEIFFWKSVWCIYKSEQRKGKYMLVSILG